MKKCACAAAFLALLSLVPGVSAAADSEQDAVWRREEQFLQSRELKDPLDYHAPTGLGYAYMRHARVTGDPSFYAKAEERFKASLQIEKDNLEAMLYLAEAWAAQHRFKDALELANKVKLMKPSDSTVLGIVGDTQLNLGDIASAEKTYAQLKAVEEGFYYLSREANLQYMKGDTAGAIETLSIALKDAPSSMPADIAWCDVQIGQLYFMSGKLDRAQEFYSAALEAWPGYAAALDHQAELYGALEKYPEATRVYLDLLAQVPRPDLQQALGDLYVYRGMKDEAQKCYALALAGYTKSAEAGNLHYAHHLAGFYCDAQENPVEALKWAKKDIEMRQSCYAYDTLAWALYKNGDYPAAAEAMNKALASEVKDAHLYFHAGVIYARAGDFAKGKACAQKALEINPMFEKFHVHR